MKIPAIIQFYIQTADEGGYTANAVEYSIHTEGDTLDQTVHNIREAVECHFSEGETKKYPVPIAVNFALPAMV
jgi:predicted RNase H-like HicB family nuclease